MPPYGPRPGAHDRGRATKSDGTPWRPIIHIEDICLEALQQLEVLERVEGYPEALVRLGDETPLRREGGERPVDQLAPGSQGTSKISFRNMKPPPFTQRSAVATSRSDVTPAARVGLDDVERVRRPHGKECCGRGIRPEGLDQLIERGVGEGVAVVGQEHVLALPETIRVATFNIHTGRNSSGGENLQLTGETLRGFDFVGLQEVSDPLLGDDQSAQLATMTGMTSQFFASERQYWHDAFGNAMLTKLPVHSWQRTPLPSSAEGSRRNATIVHLGDKQLTVIITHTARHEDQAAQLEMVSQLFLAQPEPAILMGDLNATSENPILQRLLGHAGRDQRHRSEGARPLGQAH